MSAALSNNQPALLMIDAIATTRTLPWPVSFPRRRSRLLAPGTRARAAARHGLRSAIQAMCLSAALMAAAGAVGASRGPVELSEPAPAQHHAAVQVMPGGALPSAEVARTVTSR
jgi:hypothetical protein